MIWRLYSGAAPALRVRVAAVEPLSESRVRIAAVDENAAFLARREGGVCARTAITTPISATPPTGARRTGSTASSAPTAWRANMCSRPRRRRACARRSAPPTPGATTGRERRAGCAGSTGAVALAAQRRYLWRAERVVYGAPAVGDAVAANWSEPVIVGRWGADGADGAAGGGRAGERTLERAGRRRRNLVRGRRSRPRRGAPFRRALVGVSVGADRRRPAVDRELSASPPTAGAGAGSARAATIRVFFAGFPP